MNTGMNLYYYRSLYKDEKTYTTFLHFAWCAVVIFAASRASGYFDLLIYLSRIMVPMLYAYPLYRIMRNIFKEWQNKTINFGDWLTFLIYLTVTVLVVTDQFYIRREWFDLIMN